VVGGEEAVDEHVEREGLRRACSAATRALKDPGGVGSVGLGAVRRVERGAERGGAGDVAVPGRSAKVDVGAADVVSGLAAVLVVALAAALAGSFSAGSLAFFGS
jgi:hypothetical protein